MHSIKKISDLKPADYSPRTIKDKALEGLKYSIEEFGGSGSTLIACEQLKRKSYLMELDPKFCDVIVKRYMKFKNIKTVILNNEEVIF